MANQKDMRRADLIVPYQQPAPKGDESDFSSSLATTLPMAAMLTRNRFVGWASFVFNLQSWLGESDSSRRSSATPGYFSVGMAFMALVVAYLPIFMPPPPANQAAPAPPPPMA